MPYNIWMQLIGTENRLLSDKTVVLSYQPAYDCVLAHQALPRNLQIYFQMINIKKKKTKP